MAIRAGWEDPGLAFGGGSGDAEGNLDFFGHFIGGFAFFDVKIAPVDGEVGADDDEVSIFVSAPFAQATWEVGDASGHGDVFRDALEGEGAGNVGGALIAILFHVVDFFDFEGDLGVSLHVEPVRSVHVTLHNGVGHDEAGGLYHDFSCDLVRVVRV